MNVHKKYLISFFKQNVRLLSQFVSNHTGMIYHRGITGLCIPMQKHIASLIKTSRAFGKNSHSFSMSLLLEKVFICVFLLISLFLKKVWILKQLLYWWLIDKFLNFHRFHALLQQNNGVSSRPWYPTKRPELDIYYVHYIDFPPTFV